MAGPYYIDSAAAGGGNGTSGTPYNTWASFLTGQQRDLTATGGEGEVIVYIKGNLAPASSSGMGMGTFTTGATGYLHIQPWPGFEGTGTFASTPGFVEGGILGQSNWLFQLGTNCKMTRVKVASFTGAQHGFAFKCGNNCIMDGVLVQGSEDVFIHGNGCKMRNCLVYTTNGTSAFLPNGTFYSGVEFYNNTIIQGTSGGNAIINSNSGTNTLCKNNVCYGSFGTEFSTGTGTWSASCANNAGQIATASQPAAIQTGYVQLSGSPFVNFAGGNYAPASGGQLINAGTATGAPTTDASGVTRGAPPEIGYLEEVVISIPVRPDVPSGQTVAVHTASAW